MTFGQWIRTPEEYRGLFEYWDIFHWRWTLDQCQEVVEGPPSRASCDYKVENDWSRAQGSDSVAGQLEFLVDDGLIVEVNRDTPGWGEVVRGWFSWLERSHMEQIPVMFRLSDDGRLTGGPATTPEALDLYRTYLPEYLEWENSR